jgi:hypothetical protein
MASRDPTGVTGAFVGLPATPPVGGHVESRSATRLRVLEALGMQGLSWSLVASAARDPDGTCWTPAPAGISWIPQRLWVRRP